MASPITTHILDTAIGRPAADVPVRLDGLGPDGTWSELGSGRTNMDGRVADLLEAGPLRPGTKGGAPAGGALAAARAAAASTP